MGKNQKVLFYCLWLSLNLIQSSYTGLLDDESYYWVYSRFLDWGYFDHPPMIALLIKIGYAIFPNELGVRLMVAILSTATLWLVQQLLTAKDDKLFYSIAVSIAVLQLGGIIAVPDVPLLFFTALFFHAYKRFLAGTGILNSLYLAITIAMLLYSKYHGLLVVLLTIASNPKLILNKRAYLVTLFALILFLPHLYWQYAHGDCVCRGWYLITLATILQSVNNSPNPHRSFLLILLGTCVVPPPYLWFQEIVGRYFRGVSEALPVSKRCLSLPHNHH